jgi:hypothetical protein
VIRPAYRGSVTAIHDTQGTGDLSASTPAPADEGPLVAAPTPREGWFVSLVPPPDSLPLDVDLRGPSDPVPVPPARAATDAAVPPAAAPPADATVRSGAPLPPELSPRADAPVAPARSPQPPVAPAARPGIRSLWRDGLPTPIVLGVAALVLLPGVVLDLARDGTFGLPSTVVFVLAASSAPLLLRTRSLAVGAVLPPLLFATAAGVIAWRSGLNQGTRQIGLDVGTTMAIHAPLLFAGTALALVLVAGRLVVRLVRR